MCRTIRAVLLSLVLSGLVFSLDACQANTNERSNTDVPSSRSDKKTAARADERRCGSHNGHQLYIGPKGGCYYYNSNGNKTYVDKKECNC